MFAGIIEATGVVRELRETESGGWRLSISSELFRQGNRIDIGSSIGINGVCLTAVSCVADEVAGQIEFDLASETLRKTTMGLLGAGSVVNLERCLMVGERVDGHFVLGHVDCQAALLSICDEVGTKVYTFELPAGIADLVAEKGSVAINGVSLTVGEVRDVSFCVYLIPHTLDVTNLGCLEVGAIVNLEADCLARYARRILYPSQFKISSF